MFGYIALLYWLFVSSQAGEILIGHLKPLGSHKPPSVEIDEFNIYNGPTPAEFYEKYVKLNKAAIFRDGIRNSRAFNLWTDEYIRENFGEMEVRLEGKHEKVHFPPVGEKYLGRDTLRHFVDTYHDSTDNTYIVSDLPSPMYKDVGVVPSFGSCGEMSRRIVEVDLWWSGGGTYSVLHKDAYNQMNCLVNGTKYWKLIEYKYEKDIHKHPEPDYELGGYSDINPKAVNMRKHPNITKVEWSNITIYAGDCLFLPKSYYHQVKSEGTNNLAVSLLFSRFDNRESLDFSDCTSDTDYSKVRPLSDYEIQYVWKGTGRMVMGGSDLEERYRTYLLESIQDCESQEIQCTFDVMKPLIEFLVPENQRMSGESSQAFAIVDKNIDGVITKEEVQSLSIDDLRRFVAEVELFEPSNNYQYEYSIISYETVWFMINYQLKKYDILNRDTWIKNYLALGGTLDFGNEVFSRLCSGKSSISSKSISRQNIWHALENWAFYWAPQYSSLTSPPKHEDDYLLEVMWNDGEFNWLKSIVDDNEEEANVGVKNDNVNEKEEL